MEETITEDMIMKISTQQKLTRFSRELSLNLLPSKRRVREIHPPTSPTLTLSINPSAKTKAIFSSTPTAPDSSSENQALDHPEPQSESTLRSTAKNTQIWMSPLHLKRFLIGHSSCARSKSSPEEMLPLLSHEVYYKFNEEKFRLKNY